MLCGLAPWLGGWVQTPAHRHAPVCMQHAHKVLAHAVELHERNAKFEATKVSLLPICFQDACRVYSLH